MKIKVKLTRQSNAGFYNVPKDTIHEIDFEDYIKGVVPSEIGTAPLDACKAQAVAARTFALSRIRSRGYVIDAVDQSYIATKNNPVTYPNAISGVDATKGQILTYDGKPLRECLYGASNGGQTKAYKDFPYMPSQPDHWDTAETERRKKAGLVIRRGNGEGLSQYGATHAASTGIGYREILAFYYPGSTLAYNYGGKEVSEKMELTQKERAIIEWANAQVGKGYVWGAVGQTLTQAALDKLIAQHKTNVMMPEATKWLGKTVFDCAGLITAMFSNHLRKAVTSGVSSQWKANIWEMKGTIDTLPKDRVVLLYRTAPQASPMQHGGIYTADGYAIDARGTKSGVLKQKVSSYPWTHWALPTGLLTAAELVASGLKKESDKGGEDMSEVGLARVTGGRLALRRTASTTGTLINYMPDKSVVTVLEKANATWWRVRHGAFGEGYCMAKFLEPIADTPQVQPPVIGGNTVQIVCSSPEEATTLARLLKGAVVL